ncbi:MAG: ABC-F family ATP-binding cassette domain-containing protein [Desulfovibrio sp.]|nr:ABC-F family ATP-binding cassette domain-containing protein [Desulfovibrio sp.]MCA1986959.1 ABC-F family ATP-binding cassette domain-containing protein [Desulfovibrio sp.]
MNCSIQGITKSYGARDLFKDFSLELVSGVRLAVVGANGAGKSTFLKVLAGVSAPDAGRITMPKGARLGYVAQEMDEEVLATPLITWVLEVLPSWGDFWKEWETATAAHDEKALARLASRQAELEAVYGHNPEQRAHVVLEGLGFPAARHHEPLQRFSGGWRERAKLARVLVAGADILLLDEPTNHLDLEAVEWLEQFLLAYEGVLVFVAHDRIFMDRLATHTLYFGGPKPVFRKGTFSQFLVWQEEQEEQRQREAKRLNEELERKLAFVARFKYKATKARQAGSRQKQARKLEKELEGLKPDARKKTLSFKWPEPQRGDRTPLAVVGLSAAYGDGKPLWNPIDFQIFRGQKIALAGPNGCGKSTLLKCVTGRHQPLAGRVEVSSNTKMGIFAQHQLEILDPEKTTLAEIRRLCDPRTTEEELMSVLGLFLLGQDYFERPVASLSGGEKSRLILATLFLSRSNFLVLDEPTNHLDLESREALIEALEEFDGTVLFVAHDRWLMQRVAEQVWELTPQGFVIHEEGFEAYERSRQAAPAVVPRRESVVIDDSKNTGDKPGESRAERQERKRQEAEQRKAMARLLGPKKQAYDDKEQELEHILARQAEVEQLLADPAVFADAAKSGVLLEEYKVTQERAERCIAEMEQLEAEIQALEGV